MLHAPGAFQTRLYTSLKEIIAGYSKNLYEGMERKLSLGCGAILFVFIGTLLPFLLFTGLIALQYYWEWSIGLGWVLWSGALCFLILFFRWRIERLEGRSGWYCLSHVVGNLILVWILLRAIFSIESEWKGRRFVDGKAQ
jgi:hypothetical protein